MSKYVDNVLIRLKRNYSKDEVVKALYNRVSDLKVENGKLTSYIQELEYKKESINKLKTEIKRLYKIIGNEASK